jgi:Raf kinase inhibitor-like YbhB/YbcL family protein
MLEHVPHWLGAALSGLRAGAEKLAVVDPALKPREGAVLDLGSPAFADGARLPDRFTADGAGVSPPLTWGPVPDGTAALALLVEDADAPTPQPLVHAVVVGLPAEDHALPEGAIRRDGDGDAQGRDVGRNSFRSEGWLPPDPPTGHGEHRYVFQLFAVAAPLEIGGSPGRSALLAALDGKVLAAGVLVGTYSRGEAAPVGPVGSVAPAR